MSRGRDGTEQIGQCNLGMRFKPQSNDAQEQSSEPKGFDDFELRLGDVLRGERATIGKSLLDVQRELRIKASYIAAIENCDPSVFDTPGFIAGYVRSYARYLGLEPDVIFAAFCKESGFSTAHGMAPEASSRKRDGIPAPRARRMNADPLLESGTPFVPGKESIFAGIEPGAIGSSIALLAVIGLLGFGGWSVFTEIQRVQLAPVEHTPMLVSDLDPLVEQGDAEGEQIADAAGIFNPPAEALDRLYRPEALDVPVLVPRDAPIASLDPRSVGVFAQPELPQIAEVAELPTGDLIAEAPMTATTAPQPQVVEDAPPRLAVVAVRPAWVRVRAADGSVIFEGIMNGGDSYEVPQTEEAPTIRVGESGAVYFDINGTHFGPAGDRGVVTKNLALDSETLSQTYSVASLDNDQDLAKVVAELALADIEAPQQTTAD